MAALTCCTVYRDQRRPRLAAIHYTIAGEMFATAEGLIADYVDAQLRHLRLHS